MFTRQHYERIAQAFAETSGIYEATVAGAAVDGVRDYLANELADMFAEDNPRFDRARFLAAARAVNIGTTKTIPDWKDGIDGLDGQPHQE